MKIKWANANFQCRQFLIRILSSFIPLKKWRHSFRARYKMPNATNYKGILQSTVIIPLGENCSCARILLDAGLRRYSLPFDWSGMGDEDIASDVSGGLYTKCRLIIENCAGMLNFDDFEERARERHNFDYNHRCVFNKKTGLRYLHDFSVSSSLSDQWPEFVEKYTRRIKRMYSEMEKAKRVLFVYDKVMRKENYYDKVMRKENYQARHNVESYAFSYALLGILEEFKKKWPRKTFNFLIFLHDEGVNVREYKEERPYDNITYVYLNNVWQHEESYDKNYWLGNKEVVLQYLKEHLTFCK